MDTKRKDEVAPQQEELKPMDFKQKIQFNFKMYNKKKVDVEKATLKGDSLFLVKSMLDLYCLWDNLITYFNTKYDGENSLYYTKGGYDLFHNIEHIITEELNNEITAKIADGEDIKEL